MAERGRFKRRLLRVLLVVGVVAAVWLFRELRQPWPKVQGEQVSPDESAYTARIVASAVALIDGARQKEGVYTRDVHSKAHGCVKATVKIPALDERLRVGLFAEPGAHEAWIRFSSGDTRVQSDLVRDARGFALKVMGVPGDKLLAAEKHETTQDFVMINSPQFFIRTIPDYAEFMAAMARGDRYGWFFGGRTWKPWRWHVRELYLAAKTLQTTPGSLLQTQYHSLSAYRFGPDRYVKYSARPCETKRPPRRNKADDMLREALKHELSKGEGCFDLLVQLQVPGTNMPVEDATVQWSEKDSPFVPVARVTIPRQDFDTPEQNTFCENLSFTPWHALPAHEPVGVMNRVRKALYQEISRYRHAKNQAPRAEPRGWCLDLTGATCPGEAPPSTTAGRLPSPGTAPASRVAPPSSTGPRPSSAPAQPAGPVVPSLETAPPSATPAEAPPPEAAAPPDTSEEDSEETAPPPPPGSARG